MKFTEAQLESAIIELLEAEDYPHVLGEAIERQPQEIEVVIKQLEAYSAADLYESNKRLDSDVRIFQTTNSDAKSFKLAQAA